MPKCPNCGKETLIVSIFGGICGTCYYEPTAQECSDALKSLAKEVYTSRSDEEQENEDEQPEPTNIPQGFNSDGEVEP